MPRDSHLSPRSEGLALKTLKRIDIVKDLPAETIEGLEAVCRWRECKPNEEIFNSDDISAEVYFVVRGAVRVVNLSPSGRQIGFAELGAGNVFGEISAIDGERRSATVFAKGRTVLAIVDRATFIDLLKQHPEVALRLLVHFARVIRGLNDRVLDLNALSDVQRVYYELLRRAEPNPDVEGSWLIFNMPRHKDLAEMAGTTPETVAHAVSQLMKAELVKRRAGNLELLDKDKIQELALMG